METLDTIRLRKSTRAYQEEPIDEKDLETVLSVASLAPVGRGEYDSLHLTVVQDAEFLHQISQQVSNSHQGGRDPLYGAPTLIVISSKENPSKGMDYSNASFVAGNLILGATELGLGTCILWKPAKILAAKEELHQQLELPEGFEPTLTVALGKPLKDDTSKKEWSQRIDVNRV